jgi:hypothetical protein
MKDKNTDTGNLDQDLAMDTGLNQLSASEDGTNRDEGKGVPHKNIFCKVVLRSSSPLPFIV